MTTNDEFIVMHSARIVVMELLLRTLFFERAKANGDGPEEAMKLGERFKQFLELHKGDPEGEAYMVAEIERFFTRLAADLKPQTENP